MFEQKTTITVTTLGLGLVVIGLLVYMRPAPEQIERPKPSPLVAEVMVARPTQHRVAVFSQGTVEPKREVQLVARVSGQIKSVSDNFADGAFFSENELLIQIEPIDHELAYTIASDAELKRAKLNISRTSIRGAFDGRVKNTLANVGQFVAPGTPLASAYAIDVAEVQLPLTEQQAALIDLPSGRHPSRDDLPIVEILSGPGNSKHTWRGAIVRTSASIDVRNRMIYAVAEFKDPYPSPSSSGFPPLEVGRFVEAKIFGKTLSDLVALPRHCIYRSTQVLRVSKENTINFTEVQIVQLTDDIALVRGIEEGMRIVVSPITDPYEGMAISPSPPTIASLSLWVASLVV